MNRILLCLSCLAIASCAAGFQPGDAEEEEDEMEVEVIGHLENAPVAPKYVVAAYDSPCTADAVLVRKPIGIDIMDGVTAADPSKLFALEAELVDGAEGWLCAWALDADGTHLGFAQLSDQPLSYAVAGDEVGAAHDVRIVFGR